MDVLTLFLLLLAVVLFGLAGFGVAGHPRFNLVAFGLACVTVVMVLGHPLVAG